MEKLKNKKHNWISCKMISRFVIIVLDSLGVGELPDARNYNDKGANTLGHICATLKNNFSLPNRIRKSNTNSKDFLTPAHLINDTFASKKILNKTEDL